MCNMFAAILCCLVVCAVLGSCSIVNKLLLKDLFPACYRGDLETVKYIFEQQGPNLIFGHFYTCIQLASFHNCDFKVAAIISFYRKFETYLGSTLDYPFIITDDIADALYAPFISEQKQIVPNSVVECIEMEYFFPTRLNQQSKLNKWTNWIVETYNIPALLYLARKRRMDIFTTDQLSNLVTIDYTKPNTEVTLAVLAHQPNLFPGPAVVQGLLQQVTCLNDLKRLINHIPNILNHPNAIGTLICTGSLEIYQHFCVRLSNSIILGHYYTINLLASSHFEAPAILQKLLQDANLDLEYILIEVYDMQNSDPTFLPRITSPSFIPSLEPIFLKHGHIARLFMRKIENFLDNAEIGAFMIKMACKDSATFQTVSSLMKHYVCYNSLYLDEVRLRMKFLSQIYPDWQVILFDGSRKDPVINSVVERRYGMSETLLSAITLTEPIILQVKPHSINDYLSQLPPPILQKFIKVYQGHDLSINPTKIVLFYDWNIHENFVDKRAVPFQKTEISGAPNSLIPDLIQMFVDCDLDGWLLELLRMIFGQVEEEVSLWAGEQYSQYKFFLQRFACFLDYILISGDLENNESSGLKSVLLKINLPTFVQKIAQLKNNLLLKEYLHQVSLQVSDEFCALLLEV